ncbi:MAG TPA: hypothetical protein VHR66_25765 [Gemmataceae bacterium]|jgi:hypothetical protein|nr:hypothetical protein [Gemmataceae bacterium]
MNTPGLVFSEELTATGFALQLFDGYSGLRILEGQVSVAIAGRKPPLRKSDSAAFVFLDIEAGSYSISVTPSVATPFYAPVTIPIELPMSDPLWQAYPDPSLADKTKPPDDPSQPAAYRAQRVLATLVPTPRYPFPPGATLLRGTVLAGTVPLTGAAVIRVGDTGGTASDANGEFVLFFDDVSGMGQSATIKATSSGRPDVTMPIALQRGRSVSTLIVMAP